MGPFGFNQPFGTVNGPAGPVQGRGPLLAQPTQDWAGQRLGGNVRSVKNSASNPARSAQLMTLGDRLLRAGNFKKAEERYQQSLRSGPDQAAPYVRLAQLALVRGNYSEAADRFREAEVAQPGWLITAADIQPLFGEPTEFARQLGRIESHVQTHPEDRNAWLVLGAEWFLSGRTAKAADVFRRLDDPNRKPDVALAAFLDASHHDRRPAPPGPAE
jgi:cytochrome c-type biogenesis protein CcmH/NrfG